MYVLLLSGWSIGMTFALDGAVWHPFYFALLNQRPFPLLELALSLAADEAVQLLCMQKIQYACRVVAALVDHIGSAPP